MNTGQKGPADVKIGTRRPVSGRKGTRASQQKPGANGTSQSHSAVKAAGQCEGLVRELQGVVWVTPFLSHMLGLRVGSVQTHSPPTDYVELLLGELPHRGGYSQPAGCGCADGAAAGWDGRRLAPQAEQGGDAEQADHLGSQGV